MKNYKNAIIISLTFLLISGFIFFQNKNFSSAQISKTNLSQNLKVAAEQNSRWQFSLPWNFGRKPQRGWFLYVPLIQKTINSNDLPDSEEFALAVAVWQKSRGLPSKGIIDRQTLYSFIKFWQSKRIKPIQLATEDQLLTADISNFYDPTRNIELLKIEKGTFRAYQKMIATALADKSLGLKKNEIGQLSAEEQFLKLISTYRSPAYQASLRKKEPGASRAQIAFKSPHFTGRALDIYVGGEPVTTKDFNRAIQVKTPVYKWLVKNADKFGFYPYFYEPWHWEFVPENN